MVTTLGRTGSSWLVQLLGSHPEILALDPFRVDARMATYWAEVCRALVNPASYSSPLGALQPDNDLWWLGRGGAVPPPDDIGDIQHWLATTHVTEVASFCRDRIQSFYRHAGALEGRGTHARFAVEKLNPTWVPDMVWELFPSAREIFLVRDFRDVLASVLDFNRRRGHEAFGRGDFGSDESYVRRKVRVDGESLLAAWRARRDRALLIRYEDLVLQPQETVARILAHLGMATDAASATTFIRTDLRVDESTAAHRTTTNAAASVGRWRHDLDAPLQRICDEVLGDVLLGFGYGTHDPAAA